MDKSVNALNNEEEKTAAQIDAEIQQLGIAAQQLVENPAMVAFMEDQKEQHIHAFATLPLNAELQHYRHVHLSMLAMQRFKLSMGQYIDAWEEKQKQINNPDAYPEGV